MRTTEYLTWRLQNPLSRYGFLFWEDKQLEGYLVLHQYRSDRAAHHDLNIVDWEASTVEVRSELLRQVLRVAGKRIVRIWSATLDDEATQLLVRAGFKPADKHEGLTMQGPSLLMRSLRKQGGEEAWTLGGRLITDRANWDMRMLYSMAG